MKTRTGYSGKPLYQKLGIKEDYKVLFYNEPEAYYQWLEIPFQPTKVSGEDLADMMHIFAKDKEKLREYLVNGISQIQQNGMIWVSWPKKTSKVETNITEDTIREIAFPLGLVDIKVCSVSVVWSGLKIVIRKENRRIV
ncbi:DUF3052 family protein [Aquimarina algiphila]|uniref:DUF3052 family protein n=1 Tax=Aquimarina algiphila TaxID=2047982 RepID=A0A554VPI7_9FLAO|nr:DUF3052 family protein [Aquimarina algiphila]TSE10398.1 DUF3052 family protein [Aquimarina algiphila]